MATADNTTNPPRSRAKRPPATDASRLAKCARVLDTQYWTGGGTHSIEDDDGLFGPGTEVYFIATRLARRGDNAVFLHRTRRKAIECRLVKSDGEGWTVSRLSAKAAGKVERLDRKTWCGGYRATASMMR